ncbi:pleckstrin homology domain-containing family M member 3 isoform X2 [Gadus morhua]|uniref:Pleckstrin homology domain-containing family M member 3 n=1 Tax=Gadus morhua TaxID=8049 RepID=A0A8C5CMZ9_GADMO|nr:pleckstrin homology domain-containing family M member 3 isoform X2 [Gadus morhua]
MRAPGVQPSIRSQTQRRGANECDRQGYQTVNQVSNEQANGKVVRMEVAEALDNAQDISPALEATEDFLHCLDGIYDRNRCQNHAADRQDVSNSGGGKFGSNAHPETRSNAAANVWCLLTGERSSELGPMSFAWTGANGLRPGRKWRAQSTNDLASQAQECALECGPVSNAAFRKGHHRSRSDVHYRPSACNDNGRPAAAPQTRAPPTGAPQNAHWDADRDGGRPIVVKQADLERRHGAGWSRCRLQLTPCELRLYGPAHSAGSAPYRLVTAYSLSHCQSVCSPAPLDPAPTSKGPHPAPVAPDARTFHALFFNSTHLHLRAESRREATEWQRLIWERVLASRPLDNGRGATETAAVAVPAVPSQRPSALPLFSPSPRSPDVLKVGVLHLLTEPGAWRAFTFVLSRSVLRAFLTEGRGPVSEPAFRYQLATCLGVEKEGDTRRRPGEPGNTGKAYGNVFKAAFPKEVVVLRAESASEAQSWVEVLGEALELESLRPSQELCQPFSQEDVLQGALSRPQGQQPRGAPQQKAPVTSSFLSILPCLAVEKGLTAQSFRCAGCQGQVGLSGGRAKVCCYSGWYYCPGCHQDNTFLIPARLLHNWDTGQHKVSKQAKEFLEFVYEEPLLDVQRLNPFLYQHCEALSAVLRLRQRLQSLRAYLFSCRAVVAEDLRRRIFPREYLLQHIHLYSIADLQQVIDGKLAPFLSKVIKFASSHVFSCSLCQEKGFICELCKDGQVIYPFQESATKRCKGCDAVFHTECHQKAQPCPRCVRREMHTRHSAFWANEDDDPPDCYQNT